MTKWDFWKWISSEALPWFDYGRPLSTTCPLSHMYRIYAFIPLLIMISSVLQGIRVLRKLVVFKTIPLFPASSMTHAPFIMNLPKETLPPCCFAELPGGATLPCLLLAWCQREGGRSNNRNGDPEILDNPKDAQRKSDALSWYIFFRNCIRF